MSMESWDIFDIEIANTLGVTVEEYIKTVESFETEKIGDLVVAVLDGKIDKAKQIFNTK